jgi:phage tail protein X
MGIFQGSRYKGSYIFADKNNRDIIFLDIIQQYKFLPAPEDLIVEIREGDRLDILAYQLYGDEALEWVILQANPQYSSAFDVKVGDRINVPLPEKVRDTIVGL